MRNDIANPGNKAVVVGVYFGEAATKIAKAFKKLWTFYSKEKT